MLEVGDGNRVYRETAAPGSSLSSGSGSLAGAPGTPRDVDIVAAYARLASDPGPAVREKGTFLAWAAVHTFTGW